LLFAHTLASNFSLQCDLDEAANCFGSARSIRLF
jgi:hypothetical protein